MILAFVLAVVMQAAPQQETAAPATDRLRQATPSLAELQNTTLLGYEVTGRSPRGIRSSIDESKPADPQGVRHDAVTNWRYQPRFVSRNGECLPETATVEHRITIILPDLASREALSGRDRDAWDRYFTALVGHELNHARIAETGVRQMESAMRAATTCEGIRAAITAGGAAINAASAQYDQQTRHGRTEGATFPPAR